MVWRTSCHTALSPDGKEAEFLERQAGRELCLAIQLHIS